MAIKIMQCGGDDECLTDGEGKSTDHPTTLVEGRRVEGLLGGSAEARTLLSSSNGEGYD